MTETKKGRGRKPLVAGEPLRRVTINLSPEDCAALDGFVAAHLVAFRERTGRILTATAVIRASLRKALDTKRGGRYALTLDDLADDAN